VARPTKSQATGAPDPLVERWRSEQGRALAEETFRRLAAGERLDGLPLGRHDGRVDLRGAIGPLRPIVGRSHIAPRLGTAALESLDFSGAELTNWRWSTTTVLNCRFDDANVRGLACRATRVEDTSFRRTVGVPRRLGGGWDGVQGAFRRVDFSRAELSRVNALGADFIDCDFSYAKVHKCEWWSARFVRCRFAGVLRENIWSSEDGFVESTHANEMEDVDLSGAELRWCEFRRLTLARVRLPEDAKHIVVRGDVRDVLTRVIGALDSKEHRPAIGYAGALRSRLRHLHPDCRVQVFNVKDLAESDRGSNLLAPLIRRVAAEVGATAT
jgi:uncharacterized protein YjbI with pentapeptide repeats